MIVIADAALCGVDRMHVEMRFAFGIAQTLNIDESGVEKVPGRMIGIAARFSGNAILHRH